MCLRKKTIRLAYSQPHLRPYLLPLLTGDPKRRKASGIPNVKKWFRTVVGPKVRVRIADHPENFIVVEEIPQKGQRRVQRAIAYMGSLVHNEYLNPFLASNIMRDARFSGTMTFDQAMSALVSALEKAKQRSHEENPSLDPRIWKSYRLQDVKQFPRVETVSSLEVEPADYKELNVKGKDFNMRSGWTSFSAVSSHGGEDIYEPSWTAISSKSPTAARKLYKLLKLRPDSLKNIIFSDLGSWLDKAKIAHEYSHSVWR